MMDIHLGKEYRLPVCESLRTSRIAKCPLGGVDNIFVDDKLESKGYIRLYEYLGGTLYFDEKQKSSNLVLIAGISVNLIKNEHVLHVDKIYSEFGWAKEFIPKLKEQIMNFADFYSLKVRF